MPTYISIFLILYACVLWQWYLELSFRHLLFKLSQHFLFEKKIIFKSIKNRANVSVIKTAFLILKQCALVLDTCSPRNKVRLHSPLNPLKHFYVIYLVMNWICKSLLYFFAHFISAKYANLEVLSSQAHWEKRRRKQTLIQEDLLIRFS
jgi:hypothetical protein